MEREHKDATGCEKRRCRMQQRENMRMEEALRLRWGWLTTPDSVAQILVGCSKKKKSAHGFVLVMLCALTICAGSG